MAAHLDDLWLSRLHSHATDQREVALVHLRGHLGELMGQVRRSIQALDRVLSDDKGSLDGTLIPASIQKHLSLTERDGTNVAHLMGHLDRQHEPLWLWRLQIEHFNACQEESTTFLLCEATEAVKVPSIERAEGH